MSQNEPDFLDEVIAESTAENPHFPALMEQARRNRELFAELAKQRRACKLSQTAVAAAMGTSQSAVSALEKTSSDAMISTIEKYAGALGYTVQFQLVPTHAGAQGPAVVIQPAA